MGCACGESENWTLDFFGRTTTAMQNRNGGAKTAALEDLYNKE